MKNTETEGFKWFGEEEESIDEDKKFEEKHLFDLIFDEYEKERPHLTLKKIIKWLSNPITLKNTVIAVVEFIIGMLCIYILMLEICLIG